MGWEVYVPDRGILIGQRKKLGLSQEEVAKKAGIKLEQYLKYESHDGHFSTSSMRIVNAVLTALELDPTSFAEGKYAFRPVTEDDPLYKSLSQI